MAKAAKFQPGQKAPDSGQYPVLGPVGATTGAK